MKVGVVVGNPNPGSRTRIVAEELALAIATATSEIITIDLAEYGSRLFAWPDRELDEIVAAMVSKDLLVVATPTYKAAYTGLLKAFFDRYGARGLADVFAVPVMTIASQEHSLAPELSLRPLLVELGAIVPTSSLAFRTEVFEDRKAILDEWIDRNSVAVELIRRGRRSVPDGDRRDAVSSNGVAPGSPRRAEHAMKPSEKE